MAKTGSYIKIDRGLKNNAIWLSEKPFTKGQAWVDMLMLAQGVDKEKGYNGKQKKLKRGHIYTSTRFLSTRWGWSRMRVYRFLESLVLDKMITVSGWDVDDDGLISKKRDHPVRPPCETTNETTNETDDETTNETTISIVNWALYQYSETTNETTNETARVRKTRPPNETTKRDTQEKDIYRERYTEKERIPPKSPTGGLHPSGRPERGTDEFRNKSHLLLKPEEGTVDDIPDVYRDMFSSFADYWRYRNQ